MTINADSESVIKTVDLLQSLISRMAASSGTVKNWSITLVTATVVFAADKNQPGFLAVGLIPVLLFLALDSYYLALERKFRRQYDSFVSKIHDNSLTQYDLFVVRTGKLVISDSFRAVGSISVWPFYLLQLLAIVGAAVVMIAMQ